MNFDIYCNFIIKTIIFSKTETFLLVLQKIMILLGTILFCICAMFSFWIYGQLVCFHFLTNINSAAMNTRVQMSPQHNNFIDIYEIIYIDSIDWSYALHSGCIYLHLNSSVQGYPFLLIKIDPCFLYCLFILIIFIHERGYAILVLMGISLVIREPGKFFMFLLVICISSLKQWLLRMLAYFKLSFVCFCCCYWDFGAPNIF
jgi:hypothetical protein